MERPRPATAFGVAGLLAGLLACSPVLTADGGYFDTLSDREGRTGAAVHLRLGAYDPHEEGGGPAAGGMFGVRLKFAEALTQVALSEEVLLLPTGRITVVAPYLRGGVNAFQFESLDDSFAFGMFSPYAEGGLLVRLFRDADGGSVFLSLGAAVEYDLRFTEQPNEGYWMALGGLGIGGPAWHPPAHDTDDQTPAPASP